LAAWAAGGLWSGRKGSRLGTGFPGQARDRKKAFWQLNSFFVKLTIYLIGLQRDWQLVFETDSLGGSGFKTRDFGISTDPIWPACLDFLSFDDFLI
jgi:hypothetical protein